MFVKDSILREVEEYLLKTYQVDWKIIFDFNIFDTSEYFHVYERRNGELITKIKISTNPRMTQAGKVNIFLQKLDVFLKPYKFMAL